MNPTSGGDTIVKEITIKAPAERIFEALTNPDQRLQWWGADGQYRGTHMESDLRPGGKWMTRGAGRGGKPFTVLGEWNRSVKKALGAHRWMIAFEFGPNSAPDAPIHDTNIASCYRLADPLSL